MECRNIRPLLFSDLQNRLRSIPGTSQIIDALDQFIGPKQNSQSEPLFFELCYEYGDLVVDKGSFIPPCEAAGSQCSSCASLRERVSYSSIPLSLVLDQGVEVFINRFSKSTDGQNTSIPLKTIARAEWFGTFETLDYLLSQRTTRPPWSVSAGSRSVWVLAPLGDSRLPNFLSEITGSDVYWDKTEPQWKLVKSATATRPWKTFIVVFSGSFIEKIRKNRSKADPFFKILLETGWVQSAPLRHAAVEHAELRSWFLEGPAKSIPTPMGELYQFATVCHILSIARGDAPAFQPAGSAKIMAGPFTTFENLLYEALSLLKPKVARADRYFPVVLQPGHLSTVGEAGYYSFRCPSIPGPPVKDFPNFGEIPEPIRRTLSMLRNANRTELLDYDKSSYFAQSGRYSFFKEGSTFPWQEFLSHVKDVPVGRSNLYTESAFLISGMRIVRSVVLPLTRHSAA